MDFKTDGGSERVPVLSRDKALGRLGGDLELYNEILLVFIEDLPGQADSIKSSIEGNRRHQVEQECHSLKGASANVGAEALAKISARLEAFAKVKEWEAVLTFFPELEHEVKRVTDYLHREFPYL